jgi:hypothetical protein
MINLVEFICRLTARILKVFPLHSLHKFVTSYDTLSQTKIQTPQFEYLLWQILLLTYSHKYRNVITLVH